MYLTSRILCSVSKRVIEQNKDDIIIDYNKFIYNLFFSEHFILDSIRVREIPYLIRKFGYFEVRDLLNSNDFNLRNDTYSLGLFVENPTRNFCYPVKGIDVVDREKHIEQCLSEKEYTTALKGYVHENERKELIELVNGRILKAPVNQHTPVFESFSNEIKHNLNFVKKILAKSIKEKFGKSIDSSKIVLHVEQIDDEVFLVDNNLLQFGIFEYDSHRLIGNALANTAYKHCNLYKINHDKAIGCYSEDDLSILKDSFQHLASQMNPDKFRDKFERVIDIAGLPQILNSDSIRLSKLLEVKQTAEWNAFKKWISEIDDWDDDRVRLEVNDVSTRLLARAGGTVGKSIGRAISIGGYVDNYLAVTEAAINCCTWLANKIVKPKGHVIFLYKDYPRIFK